MSDANQVNILHLDETTLGTIAQASPKNLRFESESITASYNDEESAEIHSDRNIVDVIQLGRSTGGDIVTSFSYGNLDDFIQSAMFSTWSNALAFAEADVDFVAATANHGGTMQTTADRTGNISAGDWVYIKAGSPAPPAAANTGWKQVQAITSSLITFAKPSACVAETDRDVTIAGSIIKNGITRKPISVVKHYSQLSPVLYHSFAGCIVDSLAVEVRSEARITATVSLQGTTHAQHSADSPFGSNAPGSKLTAPIMSAAVNVGQFAEGGVLSPSTTIVTGLTFNVANNLRQARDIGVLDPADIRSGRANIGGQIEVYFQDGDLYTKLVDRTETSFSWVLDDDDDNSYVFTFPRVRLRNGRVLAGGADTDIIAQYDFQALRHKTYGHSFQIGRNAA